MKPCWRHAGLEEEGAQRADKAIQKMVAIVQEVGDEDLAWFVLQEALFRVYLLPKRSREYQDEYKRENE